MVRVIRSGIVFKHVDRVVTNATDRPPIEIAKNCHQIRPYTLPLMIEFFRTINSRANRLPIFVAEIFQLLNQLIAQRFILAWVDDTLWLASFYINKDARVITAFAPHLRLAPINLSFGNEFPQRIRLFWIFGHREIALPNQPFIDRNPAIDSFPAMV